MDRFVEGWETDLDQELKSIEAHYARFFLQSKIHKGFEVLNVTGWDSETRKFEVAPLNREEVQVWEWNEVEKGAVDWIFKNDEVKKGKSVREGHLKLAWHKYKVGNDFVVPFLKDLYSLEAILRKEVPDPTAQNVPQEKLPLLLEALGELRNKTKSTLWQSLLEMSTFRKASKSFEEVYGIHIARSLFSRNKNFGQARPCGRPQHLNTEAERNLLTHVKKRVARGFQVDSMTVRELARDLMGPPSISTPSKSWYKLWLHRMEEEEEITDEESTALKFGCLQYYNSTGINWWYDTVAKELIALGLARKPANDISDELEFKFPAKVFFINETQASERRGKNGLRNGSALKPSSKGKKPRSIPAKESEQQVTFICGMTAKAQALPPVIIYPTESINKATSKKIDEIVKENLTYEQLGATNDVQFKDKLLFLSPTKSVSQTTFFEMIVSLVQSICPDVAKDDPAKNVVIFMDMRSNEPGVNNLQALSAMGILMFGLLPNITTAYEPAPVNLFGSWNERIRKLKKINRSNEPDFCKQIELGAKIFKGAATKGKLNNALKVSGMVPFSRKVHLENDLIQMEVENHRRTMALVQMSELISMHNAGSFELPVSPTVFQLRTDEAIRHSVDQCTSHDGENNFVIINPNQMLNSHHSASTVLSEMATTHSLLNKRKIENLATARTSLGEVYKNIPLGAVRAFFHQQVAPPKTVAQAYLRDLAFEAKRDGDLSLERICRNTLNEKDGEKFLDRLRGVLHYDTKATSVNEPQALFEEPSRPRGKRQRKSA